MDLGDGFAVPRDVAEAIDRIVTVQIRSGESRGNGDLTSALYARVREKQGDVPLCSRAAVALASRVARGSFVFFLTGAGSIPWRPQGETDGPLGVVSIARAIALGLGAFPVYISHEDYLPPVIAASETAGVSVLDRQMVEYNYWNSAVALPFPLGRGVQAEEAAADLLAQYHPSAIIAVEKLSPNRAGVVHGFTGLERPAPNEPFTDEIVAQANANGILTIGIGDGGNEIGYGLIEDAVRTLHPYGDVCRCSCAAGIAAASTTDVLVHGAVSNWAAYGVSACLAVLLSDPNLLHTPETDVAMLQAAVDAGAEGGPGHRQPWVDQISGDVQAALVTILRGIVAQALAYPASIERPW